MWSSTSCRGAAARPCPATSSDPRTDANDVAALSERAVFYGKCSVFEDLAYGNETGRDMYVDNCLTAMEWLFPT
jgi:hypothetical protein